MGTKKALKTIGNLEKGNEKTNFRALDVMFRKKYFENKFFINFFFFFAKSYNVYLPSPIQFFPVNRRAVGSFQV